MLKITRLRADLPVTRQCTYLNHAAVGPVPLSVAAASGTPAQLQASDPARMNTVLAEQSQSARTVAARLWGADRDRVAFIQNTSHGLSLIANGLAWQDGDEIIVSDHEFPSNYLPWLRQSGRCVQVRNFPLNEGRLDPETLARTITPKTRVVALSHVQFHNGFRADIAAIAQIARDHGALTVIDGTQSIGAMEFDLDGWGADALVFSAHKWMLCPKGIGMMLLSPRALEEIDVTIAGWQSVNDRFAFNRTLDYVSTAARFESGTENAPGIFAIAERLAQIEAQTPQAIAARILSLRGRLADGLMRLGWQITSPTEARAHSGILTAGHPVRTTEDIVKALDAANIRTSARAGALRISPHVHNTEEEVDRLLDYLV